MGWCRNSTTDEPTEETPLEIANLGRYPDVTFKIKFETRRILTALVSAVGHGFVLWVF